MYTRRVDIAIDANVLISDPWFRSLRMRALFDLVTKTGSYVMLHEVVEREVKAHFKRKYAAAVQKLQSSLKEAERLEVVGVPEFHRERVLANTYAKWERRFQEAFDSDKILRIPTGDHHYEEALRRAIERKPPCSSKGEGMRMPSSGWTYWKPAGLPVLWGR